MNILNKLHLVDNFVSIEVMWRGGEKDFFCKVTNGEGEEIFFYLYFFLDLGRIILICKKNLFLLVNEK